MRTIGELVVMGVIKEGKRFLYRPSIGEYQTNPENTGCDSIHLVTDESPYYDLHYADWTVMNVNTDKSILLQRWRWSPFFLDQIEFKGITGYLHAITELHNMCKALFSRPDLGITARSDLLEEEPAALRSCKPQRARTRAFYPHTMDPVWPWESLTIFDSISCQKRVCHQEEKFYHHLAGGKETRDQEMRKWYVPEENNPVCVTEMGLLPKYLEMHVVMPYWIPSVVEWFDDDFYYLKNPTGGEVCYGLTVTDGRGVRNQALFNSSGHEFSAKFGIMPVVYIPSYAPVIESLLDISTEIGSSGGGFNPALF